MKILHLTSQDYLTTTWSGGTTTQLLIWPAGADYASRKFSVRISSAVVALAESDFTPLPGVLRYITPLEGGFTLTHPGKSPVVMAAMDAPYRFSGGESTHCVGMATDLNLMLQGVDGEMRRQAGICPIRPGLNGFYAPQSRVYHLNGREYALAAGDLLVVFSRENGELDLGSGDSFVCWADVKIPE